MKTIWVKFPSGNVTPIEYTDQHKKQHPTFEAFCEHFRSGWQDSRGGIQQTRWAVTNSKDIEPLMHEWKMVPNV
jgi:hypothetical protein